VRQGKLPAAKEFRLAERDKHMSEEKTFMQELDDWTNAYVIVPLQRVIEDGDEQEYHKVTEAIEYAIRSKVLESYKNGCRSGAGAARKELKQRA
jgi:hypothetical protein